MELINSAFNNYLPLKRGFTLEDDQNSHFQLFDCLDEEMQLYILQTLYHNFHSCQTFLDAVPLACETVMEEFHSCIAEEFWDLSNYCDMALEELGQHGIILSQKELLEKTFANFVFELAMVNLPHLLLHKAANTMKWSKKILSAKELDILTTSFSLEDDMHSFCILLYHMTGLKTGILEGSDNELE